MSNAPQVSKLFIDGPAGQLEAVLEVAAQQVPAGNVVVCHPHPQQGGNLNNKVTYTLARAFLRLGFTALRFNFRGTGKSEGEFDNGVGELNDALTAMEWMRNKHRQEPLWVAGFSFGAAIAVKAATVTSVDGLISVAPAINRINENRMGAELQVQPDCPWLIVQGDQDELVDVEETIEWVNSLEPGPELLIIPGGEHFFHGRLIDLRESVMEFVLAAGT